MLALSNGNVSLLDSKNKSINQTKSRKTKKIKKDNNKNRSERVRKKKSLEADSTNDIFKFNMNDINKGLKLLELQYKVVKEISYNTASGETENIAKGCGFRQLTTFRAFITKKWQKGY